MAGSMWQRTSELVKKHDQGGVWIKLANDGDKAAIVFLGEPYPREVCFVDGKYMPFTDKLKAQGAKASLRVAFNVAVFDTKEVKVLEQGVAFFKDVEQVRLKYGLEKWAFEVQRHGAAKDPKTTYSILPEKQLTPEMQKELAALPLHDLEKLYGDTAEGGLGSYDNEGEPVDAKTAQSITVVLKALPKEAVERFCKKFAITRIKDLPASEVEKAVAYLDTLETEFKTADVDPFA